MRKSAGGSYLPLRMQRSVGKNAMEQISERKPNRLKNYDYTANGAYFITICVKDRKCILSRISVGADIIRPYQVQLTQSGQIVDKAIRSVSSHYDNVSVDHYVIMPNHVHLLLRIEESSGRIISAPAESEVCYGAQKPPACSAGNLPAIILFSIRRIEKHHNYQFSIFHFQLSRPALCAGEKTSAKGFQWTPFSDILNSDRKCERGGFHGGTGGDLAGGSVGEQSARLSSQALFRIFCCFTAQCVQCGRTALFCAFHII